MSRVLLIYPFFRRPLDRSRFRFPPLGVAYVAAALRDAGHAVEILDCTFLTRRQAFARAAASHADVVGVSCLATMLDDALAFALALRGRARLLVAGGPLPTCEPASFLPAFDVVVAGEGEATMVELLAAHEAGDDLAQVPGTVTLRDGGPGDGGATGGGRDAALGGAALTDAALAAAPPRPFADLDALPLPARELLPNRSYLRQGRHRYGFAVTTVMSTRGCPYACEFCSNVVFGNSYRERDIGSVMDEIAQALALGYDRISFADDVFTLRKQRVLQFCDETRRRGLRFAWECLGRVDTLDDETAAAMRAAGCRTVFFGIESGNDRVLRLMDKRTTVEQARRAVLSAKRAGLEVGAFFILFYPGDTDDSALDTLHFAGSLPLDYLGLTMPYPLPGTRLAERVGDRVTRRWRQQDGLLLDHVLTYSGDFSRLKMHAGIAKGQLQFKMKRRLGRWGVPVVRLVEAPTDRLLRLLK